MRALREKAKSNLKQLAVGGGSAGTSNGSPADGASQNECSEARVRAVEDLAESVLDAAMANEDAGSKLIELHVAGIVHVAIGPLMMQISHKVSYKQVVTLFMNTLRE
jgi:hypothetical protein